METKTISDVTQLATIVILPNIIPIMIDGMDPKVVSAIYRGYFVLSVAVKNRSSRTVLPAKVQYKHKCGYSFGMTSLLEVYI